MCLTSDDEDDPLSSYINANYIRVRLAVPENLFYISGFVRPLLFFNSCRIPQSFQSFQHADKDTDSNLNVVKYTCGDLKCDLLAIFDSE